jgi:hypothetical protein
MMALALMAMMALAIFSPATITQDDVNGMDDDVAGMDDANEIDDDNGNGIDSTWSMSRPGSLPRAA